MAAAAASATGAAKKITQATFDAAVQENIEEFGMEATEALADAITQFESQGVNLAGVIKALPGDEGRLAAFQQLAGAVEASDTAGVVAALEGVQAKLKDKDVCVYAGQHKALPLLVNTTEHLAAVQHSEGLIAAFEALARLLDGQPDLLCPPPGQLTEDVFAQDIPVNAATATWCSITETHKNVAPVAVASLGAISRACVKHEVNRQAFVDSGVVDLILHTLRAHGTDPRAAAAAADCLRTILLDDDVRVPFGKAHTKARGIVHDGDGLALLVAAMQRLAHDQAAMAPLTTTVARLAVRAELCQQIVDIGGVAATLEAMGTHELSPAVQQAGCALLRAVAGNDTVKLHVVAIGGAEAVVGAMQTHFKSAGVIEQGCGALAALTLRCEGNSRTVAALGGPSVVVKGMAAHRASLRVQRQACQALRNLVARTPDLRDAVLAEGAEDEIRRAMETHPQCGDMAKAALRDLGCKVELRELWTGTSGLGPETTGDDDGRYDD